MAITGDGSNGLVQASPSNLSNSALSFLSGSLDVWQILQDTNTTTLSLLSDLYLLSELSRFASALENYKMRMQTSMNCLLNALGETGLKLIDAGILFRTNDTTWSNAFQQYSGFEPNLSTNTQSPWNLSPSLTPQFPTQKPTPWIIPGLTSPNILGTTTNLSPYSSWSQNKSQFTQPFTSPWTSTNTGATNGGYPSPTFINPYSGFTPYSFNSQSILLGGP